MLSSVFNRRKVQKKITSIASNTRRAPEFQKLNSTLPLLPIEADAHSNGLRKSTPQIDLNYRESYSEWFPADLLSDTGEARVPPRNASLAHSGASTSSLVDDSVTGSVTGTIDDIIVIEPAPRQSHELKTQLKLLVVDSDSELNASEHASTSSGSRRPTPSPIKIPSNPAIHKSKKQTSVHLPVPNHGQSRPSSPGSALTDDVDVLESAVSGTTLAGALASSFVLTSDSRGSRYRSGITRQDSATLPRGEHPLNGQFHLSARSNGGSTSSSSGEYIFFDASGSEVPPVPPLPSSAELSARGLDSAIGSAGTSNNGSKSRRNSVALVESRRGSADLSRSNSGASSHAGSKSQSRRNSIAAVPRGGAGSESMFSPVSPIAEAPSPMPSAPNTPLRGMDIAGANIQAQTQTQVLEKMGAVAAVSIGENDGQEANSPTEDVAPKEVDKVQSGSSSDHHRQDKECAEDGIDELPTTDNVKRNLADIRRSIAESAFAALQAAPGPGFKRKQFTLPLLDSDISPEQRHSPISGITAASMYSAASYQNTSPTSPDSSRPGIGLGLGISPGFASRPNISIGPVNPTATARGAVSPVSRSYSDLSVHGKPWSFIPARATTLLPIGERRRSVQMATSPLSPVKRSVSESGPAPLPLPPPPRTFGVAPHPATIPNVPVTARLQTGDTPVDSPDLLDFMFPVESATVVREASRGKNDRSDSVSTSSGSSGDSAKKSKRERTGSQLAPLDIAPNGAGPDLLPTPVLSSDGSNTSASAQYQTFPETPYAFSPLLSAGIPPPMPPPHPSRLVGVSGKPPLPRTMTVNRTVRDLRATWAQNRPPLSRVTSVPNSHRGQTQDQSPSLSYSSVALPIPPSSVESPRGHSSSQEEEQWVLAQNKVLIRGPLSAIEEAQTLSNTPSDSSPSPDPNRMSHMGEGARMSAVEESREAAQGVKENLISQECPENIDIPADGAASVVATGTGAPQEGTASPGQSPRTKRFIRRLPPLSPLPPVPALSAEEQPNGSGSPPPSYSSMHSRTSSEENMSITHAQPAPPTTPVGVDEAIRRSPEASSSIGGKPSRAFPQSSPPSTSVPLPPSPMSTSPMPTSPMPSIEEHNEMERAPPPPYELPRPALPVPPSPIPSLHIAIPSGSSSSIIDLHVPKRNARTRPPLPIGPRKPMSMSTRSRAGSVSSNISAAGPSSLRKPSMANLSASMPRFQTTPVKFRGLTKEAAEWTFSSQQLQELVSTAIRQRADISAIRLLPLDTLNQELPEEINRLEMIAAELKTSYKLNARRRKMLLGTLASMMDGSEPTEQGSAARTVEELSDVTDSLDKMTEELYDVTTQLAQLNHLRDVHSSSALLMALHKLNKSLKKHLEEGQKLKEQISVLEAERDEAWKQAQEVAQEFDKLADKTGEQATAVKEVSNSRRSSRVFLARKNSARATRAGLRHSINRRSERSLSISSVASPASKTGTVNEIPPVPPIPIPSAVPPSSLGIVTDLPTSRTVFSTDSPSSEFRAMNEAQKEICEMLGISLDDLQSRQPPRRQSMSALMVKSPTTPSRQRRNSDSHHHSSLRISTTA